MARKRLRFLPKLQHLLKYFFVGISLTLVVVLEHIPVQATLPLLSKLPSIVAPIGSAKTSTFNKGGRGESNLALQSQNPITAPQLVQQGRVFSEAGQFEQALIAWQKAASAYTQINDEIGITGSLIDQAQALSALGFSRRACQTLTQALKIDDGICDSNYKEQLPKQKPSLLVNTG